MAIFTQKNNSCYFIHIPRTGGRYVTSLFENSDDMKCKYHEVHKEWFNDIDCTHLQYPLYNLFLNVKDIPHITIVRNPFDKFNSCISFMHKVYNTDYNNILSSYDSFSEFVTNEINDISYHNNWFLHQSDFISSKTHYWKYEWGFGKKFKNWIFDKTKIEIDLKEVEYEKFEGDINKKYKLNKRVRGYVKKFYKNDYKNFNYFW